MEQVWRGGSAIPKPYIIEQVWRGGINAEKLPEVVGKGRRWETEEMEKETGEEHNRRGNESGEIWKEGKEELGK